GQILFGVNRQEVIREECGSVPDAGLPASPARLAIGAKGLEVSVDRLRVLRDLYYFPAVLPTDRRPEVEMLGPDEVFVVGDNVPISWDSRHHQQPGVPIRNLLGPVRDVWWRSPNRPF
ncbi:MAG: S26 family signal peptidase, partial [Planctomycetes bacterium]|nr:S26 family signal peptidase [Planctomycetota bacterium]